MTDSDEVKLLPCEAMLIVTSERLAVGPIPSWDSCIHEWKMCGDGGDLGGNRTEVICRKCQCPGDFEDHSWRIVWPTT